MTKLTDGSQTIGITMCIRGYAGRRRPDISAGFFDRKSFFDPEAEVYNKENGFTRRVTVEAI